MSTISARWREDNSNQQHSRADVVIVGGGLGGLAAAVRLGRAGLRVIVCERAPSPGGRGRTLRREGFSLNLGPHALYAAGPAAAMLRELGIEPRGRMPSGRGGVVIRDGCEHPVPATPLSILTSSLLRPRSKFELIRFFARVGRMASRGLEHVSASTWLDAELSDASLRALIAGLVRLSTYCGELDTLSAAAALLQLQLALRGVWYLDGGWAQLVDAMVERCVAAKVELRCGARVVGVFTPVETARTRPSASVRARSAFHGLIGRSDAARWAVELEERTIACEQVIVAGSPTLADALLGPLLGGPRFVGGTRPITAACLDLGLRGEWPGPEFIFDLDEPIYLSVHSRSAALAPAGHSLISLAWYRRDCDADTPAAELRARLERCARRWVPQLESVRVVEQFLPEMVVAHDRPQPDRGGLQGRPGPRVGEGLFVIGDWVGEHGQLLDASLASAATVCELVLAESSRAPRVRLEGKSPLAGGECIELVE